TPAQERRIGRRLRAVRHHRGRCARSSTPFALARAMTPGPRHVHNRRKRSRARGLMLAAALFAPACTGVQPPPPPTPPTNTAAPPIPVSLVLPASSAFNHPLAVSAQVLSADGTAVPNIPVAFSIGAGSIAPATVSTDVTGMARATAVVTANTNIAAAT